MITVENKMKSLADKIVFYYINGNMRSVFFIYKHSIFWKGVSLRSKY